MKISFCITCMGRLHHLRQTLPRNLEENAASPDVEFVVVDYNSKDGLEDWARGALGPAIASGRVVYYKEKTRDRFDIAHAKNLAHGLATGDILCNLDADGFTGRGFAALLAEKFREKGPDLFSLSGDGSLSGRIAMTAPRFRSLRGYDEDFVYGWGYEDDDLVERALRSGLRPVEVVAPGQSALEHSDAERLANTWERSNTGDRKSTRLNSSH